MTYLDLTLPTPAENLACDETLLDWRETDGGADILRFWESGEQFVVVGYAGKVASEVNVAACTENNVPVFRRCSGGGTVLQGPGCLNYSLILKLDDSGPLGSITSANRFIMERNRDALAAIAKSKPGEGEQFLEVRGHTDLVMDGRKFSGNAQRRRRRFLLFHGTFLLRFNVALVEKYLPLPDRQPDYRQKRSHRDFLTDLKLPADTVKAALRDAWKANGSPEIVPRETISRLARDKYASAAWNFKF